MDKRLRPAPRSKEWGENILGLETGETCLNDGSG